MRLTDIDNSAKIEHFTEKRVAWELGSRFKDAKQKQALNLSKELERVLLG